MIRAGITCHCFYHAFPVSKTALLQCRLQLVCLFLKINYDSIENHNKTNVNERMNGEKYGKTFELGLKQ